ncbi:MAG: ribonuclease R [Firmicutes bacterium]|nr:ribonuclease R [Bacillota bacterium]
MGLDAAVFEYLEESGPVEERQVWRELGRRLTPAQRTQLRPTLEGLRRRGWIRSDAEGRLRVEVVEGRLRLNPRGFGFVTPNPAPEGAGGDAAAGGDIFIPARALGGGNHDDVVRVWVRPDAEGPGPEGRVMEVVERTVTEVVGRLERAGAGWRVTPADPRQNPVAVAAPPAAQAGQARPPREGDIVVARIREWATGAQIARGEIVRLVGRAGQPDLDVRVIMAQRHLTRAFPGAVMAEAGRLARVVDEAALHEPGRLDLSDLFVVTIDGADAKDLDDAISLEPLKDGWRVGVHIADVSHYVREGSALDEEALARGTSVYLVDRVIPMLPPALSNGLASLNPGVPRLTVSAFIDLDARGVVQRTRFRRSFIVSKHRLTYEAVNRALAGEDPGELGPLLPWLRQAMAVKDILRAKRLKRGALDFDLPEPKILLDPRGYPAELTVRERGEAQMLIEEFMILANEAVARELLRRKLPGLFRVHEPPAEEKLEEFRLLLGSFGYRLPRPVTPKALQGLLAEVAGKPEERVIQTVMLRTMRQAHYAPANLGHFGLASRAYTHFTSPIRRYPDLWVHRVLTRALEGAIAPDTLTRWEARVEEVGTLSSQREREAMEAERDSVEAKQALYMQDKVGQEYEGVVSGVTGFGVFVELDNLVEGLIRLEDLSGDHWRFDPVHHTLTGARSGRVVRLGERLRVRVASVDITLHRINFVPAEGALAAVPVTPAGRRRRRTAARA